MDNLCELSDEELSPKRNEVCSEPKADPVIAVNRATDVTASSCLSTSPLMSPNTSRSLLPQQAIRSQLRRDFLRLLSSLHKRKVSLKLYECPLSLSATFEACDHNFSQLLVSDFKTPIGLEKSAIVRTNDIIEIHVPLNDSQHVVDPNH